MKKVQTLPQIHIHNSLDYPTLFEKNVAKFTELSFAQTDPLELIRQNPSAQFFHLQDESIHYTSGSSHNNNILNQFKNAIKKTTKQEMIVKQLQQNEELRLNLFKAEKTIVDLQTLCKQMQNKVVQLIQNSEAQFLKKCKIDKQKSKVEIPLSNEDQITKRMRQKVEKSQQMQKEHWLFFKKQEEITQIWKNCYSDLLEYVNKYTKDISILTEQYKKLEQKSKSEKRNSINLKKKEQNLLKIIQESNTRLQNSEKTMGRAAEELKQKDARLDEYQLENKNLKLKIIQYLQQIEKLKRDFKLQLRDETSYKQLSLSLQSQINDLSLKCQSLQLKIISYQKLEVIFRENQEQLREKARTLEDELTQVRKFNENLIEEYKKVTSQIENQEQRIAQKETFLDKVYLQRISQFQKIIETLKKQKQLINERNEMRTQSFQNEIGKLIDNKVILEKQLTQLNETVKLLKFEMTKKDQKYSNSERDMTVMLEQKQRQIQHLQELKRVSMDKNEQLKIEIQEIKMEMLLILQQLKVKELETEKYKYLIDFKSKKGKPREKRILGQSQSMGLFKLQNNFSSKELVRQFQINELNENEDEQKQRNGDEKQNEGIIWKKIKRLHVESYFQNQQNVSQILDEDSKEKNRQKQLTFKNSNEKTFQEDDNDIFLMLKDYERQIEERRSERKEKNYHQTFQKSPSCALRNTIQNLTTTFNISSSDTPKSKFSLQAFHNKMGVSGVSDCETKLRNTTKTLFA